jgi:hypothetical protein
MRVALMDFKKTGDYASDLRALGLTNARAGGPIFWIFPPGRSRAKAKSRRSPRKGTGASQGGVLRSSLQRRVARPVVFALM